MHRSLTKDAEDGTKVGERGNFVPGSSESICNPLHETRERTRGRSCKLLILRRKLPTLPREGWHHDCLVNRVRVWGLAAGISSLTGRFATGFADSTLARVFVFANRGRPYTFVPHRV
jgi:hypothetical protein